MEKPKRPKVPQEAKIELEFSEEQKKALDGKDVLRFMLIDDKLVTTDMSSPAYKKHAEAMELYKKEKKKYDDEIKAKRISRIKSASEKKVTKLIKSENYAKRRERKAKEDKIKIEKRIARAKKTLAELESKK